MKVKVKFDAAALKKWAFEHGEKVAFGSMVVVFLLFSFFAIRRETLDANHQPDKLQSIANEVKAKVAGSKWKPEDEQVALIDYGQRAKREPVDVKYYVIEKPINIPLADDKIKREDPTLFNVEEVRVAGGFGPFALKEAAAAGGKPGGGGNAPPRGKGGPAFRPPRDAKLEAHAWVVITALVPWEKQAAEYERVFDRSLAEDKVRDRPHYAGPMVERAEVKDSDPNKLEWKAMSDPTVFEARWVSTLPEIVAAAYIEPSLTAPLGPLVGTDWDESVVHPKIPLGGEPVAEAPAPPAAAPAVAAAPGNADTPQDDQPAKPDAGGVLVRGKPKEADSAPPSKTDAAPAKPKAAGYRLLRVFDYSVEPNKRYRYRIKLGLENPNYGVAVHHLKNPEAPRPQMRATAEWTAPSDVVSIPTGNGVLAGAVKPQKTSTPFKAKLLLTAIDKENGFEAAIEQEFERGAVANVSGRKVKARDPRTDQITEPTEVDFKSDTVVLDIYGGRALTKKRDSSLASPVEVLLLDSTGHLQVRSELDDHSMYEQRKVPQDDSSERSPLAPDKKKK